jgi:hypothetical protein
MKKSVAIHCKVRLNIYEIIHEDNDNILPPVIFIKNILKKSYRPKKLTFIINDSKIRCFIPKLTPN